MISRLIVTLALVFVSYTATAGELVPYNVYVCQVSYEPVTAAPAPAGKSGFIFVRFARDQYCTQPGGTYEWVNFCSKGATSPTCPKTNGQYDPFALQMLYGALLGAMEKRTAAALYLDNCINGVTKCVYSVQFLYTYK